MSLQRQLNALLFELQAARTPLERAKILARAWRTVRDLSPTDRRLLARHAGFEGAQAILEGLAARRGGLAPALLLRVLGNARASDGAAVSELLGALRDPSLRSEAVDRGLEAAQELLRKPGAEAAPTEVDEALGELHAVVAKVAENPEQALAALTALEAGNAAARGEPADKTADHATPTSGVSRPAPSPPGNTAGPRQPEPPTPAAEAKPAAVRPAEQRSPRRAAAPEWEVLASRKTPAEPPGPDPQWNDGPGQAGDAARFDAGAVLAALGAEDSVFSRLLVLHRELSAFRGSSAATLRELVLSFPDGWPRRRVLVALLEGGIVATPDEGLELIATLDREVDRRWCLGRLAAQGEFKGSVLQRALDLVTSPSVRRRLAGG
jgi:hypothetical protein